VHKVVVVGMLTQAEVKMGSEMKGNGLSVGFGMNYCCCYCYCYCYWMRRKRRSCCWYNLMCLRIDLCYNIAKIGYFEGMVGDWQGRNKEELGGMLGMMSEMCYLKVDLVGGDCSVNYEAVEYCLISYLVNHFAVNYYYNCLDENSFDDFVVVVVAVVAVAIVVAFVVVVVVVVVPVTSSDSSY